MTKQLKKKTHIKILPVIILLLVLVVFILFAFVLVKLPIKNIYIKNNYYLTDQEVIDLAGIEKYPSFILTSKNKMKKKIVKNEIVNKVNISKKFWGKVVITIDEHNILFRKFDDDSIVVLDNGKEIEDSSNKYIVPKLLNYVPDNKYNDFLKAMNKINEDIKIQISEITYVPNEQDKDRFLLYMNDGNYVYLTLTKFKQINYYEDVLEELGNNKGILYLDSGNHFKIMN